MSTLNREVIWEKDPHSPKLKSYTVRVHGFGLGVLDYRDYDYRWKWRAWFEAQAWAINGYRVQIIHNYSVRDTD